jgi:hypothetical protein
MTEMLTIRPITDNTFRLGAIDLPVTIMPHKLRQRYDLIMGAVAKGDTDLAGALRALSRDIQIQCGSEILLRAAQRTPETNGAPGLKARIKDLSARAKEYADREKKKEGIKAGAGEAK